MSWTLARHCKVTVDKTSRCRGRVSGTQHWYWVVWAMAVLILLLYKRTVINYLFTCSLKWHYLSGAGEMSAKYLRNWANIVQILCKYRSIVPTNTKNWTYSNLGTQSSTLAQHYTTIGPMPRVFLGLAAKNEVLYVWFSETLLLKSRLPLQWLLVLPYSMVTCKCYISIPSCQRHV